MILKASDTRDAANLKLYASKPQQQSIDKWMLDDIIPLRLKMYCKKKSYIVSGNSSRKVPSSGQTFTIEYISLSIFKKKVPKIEKWHLSFSPIIIISFIFLFSTSLLKEEAKVGVMMLKKKWKRLYHQRLNFFLLKVPLSKHYAYNQLYPKYICCNINKLIVV